jgi:hypothetical protein
MSTPAIAGRTGPSGVRGPAGKTTRWLLIAVVLIIVFGLVRGLFAHHETTYEQIAREMTVDLQNNDLAGVQSFQNAETATLVTHAVVGRDADAFQPLGKLQRVIETPGTPEETTRRIHEFDASFDKGIVHETIRFDPDNKVVGFKYDLPQSK